MATEKLLPLLLGPVGVTVLALVLLYVLSRLWLSGRVFSSAAVEEMKRGYEKALAERDARLLEVAEDRDYYRRIALDVTGVAERALRSADPYSRRRE